MPIGLFMVVAALVTVSPDVGFQGWVLWWASVGLMFRVGVWLFQSWTFAAYHYCEGMIANYGTSEGNR